MFKVSVQADGTVIVKLTVVVLLFIVAMYWGYQFFNTGKKVTVSKKQELEVDVK